MSHIVNGDIAVLGRLPDFTPYRPPTALTAGFIGDTGGVFELLTEFTLRLQWRPVVTCDACAQVSASAGHLREEVAMFETPFRRTSNGHFMHLHGPAWNDEGRCCNKKLCFVGTDKALLADVLLQLTWRHDCYYVKYSVHPRDGMYLGRCFLMNEHEVGKVWALYKAHPRLFCSVQDDDFTEPFRPA